MNLSMTMTDNLAAIGSNQHHHIPTGTAIALIRRGLITPAIYAYDNRHVLTTTGVDTYREITGNDPNPECTVIGYTTDDETEETPEPVKPAVEPFRPAYKTIIEAGVTYTLQGSYNGVSWSYVSDHGSEEDATHRAHNMLMIRGGTIMRFRVMEVRTEVKVTPEITLPERPVKQPRYYVTEINRSGYTIVDRTTGEHVMTIASRYAAHDKADRLNAQDAG